MNSLVLTSFVVLLSLAFLVGTLTSDPVGNNDAVMLRQVRNVRGKNGGKGTRGGNNNNGGSSVVAAGGANAATACRYTKGTWGECDPTSNLRTRTLTLKRGAQEACESSKTETRKCKKACRYVKGQWSECDGNVHMKERLDQLKTGSDPSCEPTRRMTKKCKGKFAKKQ